MVSCTKNREKARRAAGWRQLRSRADRHSSASKTLRRCSKCWSRDGNQQGRSQWHFGNGEKVLVLRDRPHRSRGGGSVLWEEEEELCEGKALGLTCADCVLTQSSPGIPCIRNMRELDGHQMNDINLTDVSE